MLGKTRFLLPASFRFVGIIFLVAGVLTGFARFYLGVKSKLLNAKVFAVYSEYLDDRYLKFVNNNLGEEITILLVIAGLFLIAFSHEKEENETIAEIRYKSLILSFYIGFVFLMAANFLTFGFAFIYMLILYSGLPLVMFIVLFQFHLYLYRKSRKRIEKKREKSV